MSEIAENITLSQLTLFAEDSLVSLTVWPGSKEARRMTVTSGQNIAELLPNSGPIGYLLKMCLASERLCSTRCYLTWMVWRTPRGRLLFRLAPLMPRIDENEFSLWLGTPKARQTERSSRFARGRTPTPVEFVKMWPTPRANPAMAATITEEANPNRYPNLETVLKKRDSSVVGGQLNPMWVEWLMGFPTGWTDLEHSETP